jgi:hypothetical protein
MPFDYSEVPPAREFDLIPNGTIATVQMTIRPGGAGEGGLLKRSKLGDCEMLDVELVITDGTHAKRKFWENMILAGVTDGHAKAAEISQGKLRCILESARGIRPDDMSTEARKARTANLADFNGMIFIAKIGIEKGRPKNNGGSDDWPDKNILAAIITPEKKEWHQVAQSPVPVTPAAAPTATVIEKPKWAS